MNQADFTIAKMYIERYLTQHDISKTIKSFTGDNISDLADLLAKEHPLWNMWWASDWHFLSRAELQELIDKYNK